MIREYGKSGDVQCIVLTEDEYGDSLWDIVGEQLLILIRGGYQVQVYEEENGIVVVKFAHLDPDLSGFNLEWLNEEESELLYESREEDDYEYEDSCCSGDCLNCEHKEKCYDDDNGTYSEYVEEEPE